MKIILKPISSPELDEIVITDPVFAIGRNESPFSRYNGEVIATLSRRHARLFEEGGQFYVADLESQNGTAVNGKPVAGKPVLLGDRDEICFANRLSYAIEILDEDSECATKLVSLRLILIPTNAGIERIVVSNFPFLISKSNPAFTGSSEQCADEVGFLSRRHAHIFQSGNGLFVEDLGSTNGTFVCGSRLQEHAKELKDGDTLAFGGDYFVYSAQLERQQFGQDATLVAPPLPTQSVAAEPTSLPEPEATPDKTVFISMASSFLEIFCTDENPAESGADSAYDSIPDEGKRKPGFSRSKWLPNWAKRIHAFFAQLRSALAEERPSSRSKPHLVFGAFTVLALSGALWFYVGQGTESEIRDLLSQGQYSEASAMARRLLDSDPANKSVIQLAKEAMLGQFMPDWLQRMNKSDFPAAKALIRNARKTFSNNPGSEQMLNYLDWVTDLEKFVVQRGGIDTPIEVFKHEKQIKNIVEYWESDPKAHHNSLAEIARLAPSFEPVHFKILSHMRTLRSESSIYLPAIERFTEAVSSELADPNSEEIDRLFDEFESKYPTIKGFDALNEDWNVFRSIQQLIDSNQLIKAIRLVKKSTFTTPIFRDAIKSLKANSLPPADTIDKYILAADAWQSGNVDTALDLMSQLSNEDAGELANAQLQRMVDILSARGALVEMEGKENYGDRLIAFYGQLDPVEDHFLVEDIKKTFETHKDSAIKRSENSFFEAQKLWSAYQSKGGLGGKERLEARVSDKFRSQASILSKAYQIIFDAVNVYHALNLDAPYEWNNLFQEITSELRLQSGSLKDLKMVLEPALLKEKLSYLTEVKEPRQKNDSDQP